MYVPIGYFVYLIHRNRTVVENCLMKSWTYASVYRLSYFRLLFKLLNGGTELSAKVEPLNDNYMMALRQFQYQSKKLNGVTGFAANVQIMKLMSNPL